MAAIEDAAKFDPTLAHGGDLIGRLRRRYVVPKAYSRRRLFERMLRGEPNVMKRFPTPAADPLSTLPPHEAGLEIARWFTSRRALHRYRVFTGPEGVSRQLTLSEIGKRWQAAHSRLGITDLHIRGTAMEQLIDVDELSRFNVLPVSTANARYQEMFSFVVSTRGHTTDSHSDAPDSSNFCFSGKKLWLAWDTYQGAKVGLQDVERVKVRGRARFDLETWLSLPSACWFLVCSGQALFLPAQFTHKVITLEPYIGVGSFFVSPPNCLRLLAHWLIHAPLWIKGDRDDEYAAVIGDIAESVRDIILASRSGSAGDRARWGLDYLQASAERFLATRSRSEVRALLRDSRFGRVAEVIDAAWPA